MRILRTVLITGLAVVALAGCAVKPGADPDRAAEAERSLADGWAAVSGEIGSWFAGPMTPIDLSDPRAANIDWGRARTLEFTFGAEAMEPLYLMMEKNRPYRLVVRNADSWPHELAAQELFSTAVVESVRFGRGNTLQPARSGFNLLPGEEMTVTLMPTRSGVFDLHDYWPWDLWGYVGRVQVWSSAELRGSGRGVPLDSGAPLPYGVSAGP